MKTKIFALLFVVSCGGENYPLAEEGSAASASCRLSQASLGTASTVRSAWGTGCSEQIVADSGQRALIAKAAAEFPEYLGPYSQAAFEACTRSFVRLQLNGRATGESSFSRPLRDQRRFAIPIVETSNGVSELVACSAAVGDDRAAESEAATEVQLVVSAWTPDGPGGRTTSVLSSR